MAEDSKMDFNRELMVDGNAVAGLLRKAFGIEMTTSTAQCDACGAVSEVGGLLVFRHGPDAVLRCPSCERVVIRVAETPHGTYVDSRGAVYIRVAR
jgi:hypothetical protein